jgi:hypothetical protein
MQWDVVALADIYARHALFGLGIPNTKLWGMAFAYGAAKDIDKGLDTLVNIDQYISSGKWIESIADGSEVMVRVIGKAFAFTAKAAASVILSELQTRSDIRTIEAALNRACRSRY